MELKDQIPVWLDAEAVGRRLDPAGLIAALERAFTDAIQAPRRAHHALGPVPDDGTLLIMPAWRAHGPIGVKIATVLPRNAALGKPTIDGLYVLLGPDGGPRALIEAKALTLARTAAVSALAASRLAAPDARTLLMVGAGALAPHMVRAHLTVRPYRRVMVWARSRQKAETLAATLRDEGAPAEAAARLDDAVAQADVVSCATQAREPLIRGAALRSGAHLDLVGGYTPDMREADDDAVRRARVFADAPAALCEAGDLTQPIAAGLIAPSAITDLATLLRTGAPPAAAGQDVTLFKSVGTALADFAAAEHLLASIKP